MGTHIVNCSCGLSGCEASFRVDAFGFDLPACILYPEGTSKDAGLYLTREGWLAMKQTLDRVFEPQTTPVNERYDMSDWYDRLEYGYDPAKFEDDDYDDYMDDYDYDYDPDEDDMSVPTVIPFSKKYDNNGFFKDRHFYIAQNGIVQTYNETGSVSVLLTPDDLRDAAQYMVAVADDLNRRQREKEEEERRLKAQAKPVEQWKVFDSDTTNRKLETVVHGNGTAYLSIQDKRPNSRGDISWTNLILKSDDFLELAEHFQKCAEYVKMNGGD